MESQPSHRLGDATKAFLLSRTVRDLLLKAYTTRTTTPAVDINSFMATVVSSRSTSTAVTVVKSLFSRSLSALLSSADVNTRASEDVVISDGLWAALEHAQKLRLATGGNDQFVGLRYVTFAILTAQDGVVAQETAPLLAVAGVDRRDAAMAIARYCMERHEPGENYYVWLRLLTEGGLSDALAAWAGEVPPPPASAASISVTAPPPRDPSIALLQPDDPWSLQTLDHSGARLEAMAFADMVVAKPFLPPLAVGIFGEWGSGKSYFMRLRYARARQTGGITFCQNVVQIRFNAWHYAEENLWASLVDHIFTSLNQWAISTGSTTSEADRLFDQLTTARRLTIEAATQLVDTRILKAKAAQELASAEATLRDKQSRAEVDPRTFVQAAFDSLLADASIKPQLDKAAGMLGLTGLSDSAQSLLTTSTGLNDELGRFAMFRNGLARQLAAPGIIAFVAAGTLLLPPLLSQLVTFWHLPAAQFGAGIAGLVAPLVVALGWAGARAKDALDIVSKYRAQFDIEIEKSTAADKAQVGARARELADAEAALLEARKSLDSATASANDATLAYNMETGGSRVLRFVRDRVAAGEYARHLSFVASIRKDFEELSRLLAQVDPPTREAEDARKAHEKRVAELLAKAGNLLDADEQRKLQATAAIPADDQKVFERIVLYIDDLDRCQPEQVVAVLQAVHMLLSFPLFVVFVAVDVRWVRNALVVRYPDQLGRSSATKGDELATTSDYLEKIFQIPYWVRAFSPSVTRALLADRIGPSTASPAADDTAAPAGTSLSPDDGRPAGARQAPPELGAEPPTGPSIRQLVMTPQERSCIEGIAVTLDGLPRRTLRFINTYWIIKGGLDSAAQNVIEASGYRALVALLAIAIGLGEDFPTIAAAFSALSVTAPTKGEDTLKGVASAPVLTALQVVAGLTFQRPDALQHINACLKAAGEPNAADLGRYADIVSRYSFHRGE